MNTTVTSAAISIDKPEFKTWKTIKLGTGLRTVDDFKNAGMKIRDGEMVSVDMLNNPDFRVADNENEIDLVVVTVAELGFSASTDVKEICIRAKELGLLLCPAEVGPQLQLQYADQTERFLQIAMEPIRAFYRPVLRSQTASPSNGQRLLGYLFIFVLANYGDGGFLSAGRYGNVYGVRERFVFLRGK